MTERIWCHIFQLSTRIFPDMGVAFVMQTPIRRKWIANVRMYDVYIDSGPEKLNMYNQKLGPEFFELLVSVKRQ